MMDWNQIYGMIAPDPNKRYGHILPFARYETPPQYTPQPVFGQPYAPDNPDLTGYANSGGEYSVAMPGAVREGVKGVVDLAHGTETGSLTPEALQSVTFGSLGAGLTMGPAGSIAMGGSKPGNFIRAYHGSPHSFERFDIAKAGSTTDTGQLGRAVYAATDPRVAEGSAHRYELNITPQNPIRVELPDFRTDKTRVIRDALGLPETATAQDIAAAALSRGHDAAILDYGPTGYFHQEIAAYDPAIIEILRKYMMGGPVPLSIAPMPNGMRKPEDREY